jgi:hypothetical protein
MKKNITCEFTGCKEKVAKSFSIGDVKTLYCDKHGSLICKVFVENNLSLLDKIIK